MTAVLCFTELTSCPIFPLYWHNILLPPVTKCALLDKDVARHHTVTKLTAKEHRLLFGHHVRFRQHFTYSNISKQWLLFRFTVLYRVARQGAAYTACSDSISVSLVYFHTLIHCQRTMQFDRRPYLTRYTYGTWHATLTLSSKHADFHRPLWQSLGVHNNYTEVKPGG